MIAVTHFKGHPLGVFGGALKNIGIGCGSKRGKLLTPRPESPDLRCQDVDPQQHGCTSSCASVISQRIDRLIANCPFDCFTWTAKP